MFSITLLDYAVLPFYVCLIYIIAYNRIKNRTEPEYRYYIPALLIKIFGGVSVAIIYHYYYGGGDTINYFHSSVALLNLGAKHFGNFLSILGGNLSPENISNFSHTTGYPLYLRDEQAFVVVRITSLFVFFGAKLYLPASALVSWFTFSGLWKLYQIFVAEFPHLSKQLAYSILFMPSVIFWGSGILKDSYCLTALAWIIYAAYRLFTSQHFQLKYYVIFALFSYLLIAIKPYIFLSASAGLFVWISFEWIGKIQSKFLKLIAFPFVFIAIIGAAALFSARITSAIGGHYASMDIMLERAAVVQEDLTREYYGHNSFDIGAFEPTLAGISKKIPAAITAGIFRPFIWESRSIFMIFSGLENFVLLVFSIGVFLRVGPFFFINKMISKPHILIFSITFSLIFAFAVGLTTANFGALVRYKIPLVPFYFSAILIINDLYSQKKAFNAAHNEDDERMVYKDRK